MASMNEYAHDVVESVSTIRNSGILLYPTDTVWGIGGDATNDRVIDKIMQLKKRPLNKSLVVLIADMPQLIGLTGPLDPILDTSGLPTDRDQAHNSGIQYSAHHRPLGTCTRRISRYTHHERSLLPRDHTSIIMKKLVCDPCTKIRM